MKIKKKKSLYKRTNYTHRRQVKCINFLFEQFILCFGVCLHFRISVIHFVFQFQLQYSFFIFQSLFSLFFFPDRVVNTLLFRSFIQFTTIKYNRNSKHDHTQNTPHIAMCIQRKRNKLNNSNNNNGFRRAKKNELNEIGIGAAFTYHKLKSEDGNLTEKIVKFSLQNSANVHQLPNNSHNNNAKHHFILKHYYHLFRCWRFLFLHFFCTYSTRVGIVYSVFLNLSLSSGCRTFSIFFALFCRSVIYFRLFFSDFIDFHFF